MLKHLIRRLSALRLPTNMPGRYFVNQKPDFEEAFGLPQVPEQDIKRFVDNLVVDIENHFKPIEKNGTEGVYLGTAGTSYMFYRLSKIPTFQDQKESYLNKALNYIKPAIAVYQFTTKNKQDLPSLILGHCGVYAVASVVYHAIGDETQSKNFRDFYYRAADLCKDQNFLHCGSDELFVGRAGYLMGALWLAKETKTPLQKNDLYEICRVMVRSGRDYSVRHHSPCPLMYAYYGVEYLGAAHGLCTILQSILSVPGYLDANPGDAADVKTSLDYLLSIQTPEGNFPATLDEMGRECKLVHWCHGAPGMFYLMAKAYLVLQDGKYLESCKRMADLIWERGLLKKGPGLCHGVAGNGYVFLILYRMTGVPMYLHRGVAFYKFMSSDIFKAEARRPDNPYSLYEGTTGTVCYLADLTSISQAVFPFSDIF
ncbi:lanC-like protein 3 homolog [Cylas formicarius]|uniref:lanC-like protein 3 homolog n=1 Tax=Cylas formicarius TaxID=197179 RepID=UPI00295865A9|nr:lanC-like protein 3 homolog [Cylas formicarius]XP_060521288.1 lanC-like protein 3 homolog [Cylas formicarius]XP_060521296.1 lanC-like protein 3 homolog [Cylas formicarius]